jgi:type I restriction enzyme S subunit
MNFITLKKISVQIKDGTHGSYERLDIGQPLLSAKNIKNGKVVINDDESKISNDDHESIIKPQSFRKGDILFTTVGTIGEAAILENDDLAFQRSVASIRPKKNIYNKYLYWSLKNIDILNQINRKIKTTAQSGFYLGDLGRLLIYDYEYSKQIRISNFSMKTAIK